MRLNKPSGSQEAFLLQHSLNPQIYEILIAAIYQESNVCKLWVSICTVSYLHFGKTLQGLCVPLRR